ncbi:hypothetical protein GCM10025789_12720 [Tessaracoccus lubricantis]|uniref:Uncharacterized protein n=1 Tax=Tessaracoccus lubricantis TaxID=545543 RepID=A0ABP9F9G3_9ACTN
MRQTDQLKELEFTPSKVKVADWDLRIPIAPKAGPFCQLLVEPTEISGPGVFAWVVTDKVVYVGHTEELAGVSHPQGAFSVVSPSTVDGAAAKVNNLMNAAYKAEHRITWWWRQEISADDAAEVAADLVVELDPLGNKLTRAKAPAQAAGKGTLAAGAAKAPRTPAEPKQKAPKAPAKYDPERVAPKALVCPSCFIQVSLATGWCDDCEIQVAG